MKIRYMSNLHIEFPWVTTDWVPSIGEDVVVLAGDIGTGVRGIEWAVHAFRGRPVVYVLGNHEFYRAGWDSLIVQARTAAAGTHVHVLEDDAVDIGGVRFLGATLWTDFEIFGQERRIASMTSGQASDCPVRRRLVSAERSGAAFYRSHFVLRFSWLGTLCGLAGVAVTQPSTTVMTTAPL